MNKLIITVIISFFSLQSAEKDSFPNSFERNLLNYYNLSYEGQCQLQERVRCSPYDTHNDLLHTINYMRAEIPLNHIPAFKLIEICVIACKKNHPNHIELAKK